jgi:competence protein ComEA
VSTTSPIGPAQQPQPEERPTGSSTPNEVVGQPQTDRKCAFAAELDPQDDVIVADVSAETDGLRDREQTALAALLLISLTFLGWRYYEVATRQPRTFVIEKASDEIGYQIDINSATWFELSQLEAIGPVLARRIVADRDTNGPFRSIDDLQRVKGIGPRTVERNRRWMSAAVKPTD